MFLVFKQNKTICKKVSCLFKHYHIYAIFCRNLQNHTVNICIYLYYCFVTGIQDIFEKHLTEYTKYSWHRQGFFCIGFFYTTLNGKSRITSAREMGTRNPWMDSVCIYLQNETNSLPPRWLGILKRSLRYREIKLVKWHRWWRERFFNQKLGPISFKF